MGILDLFSIDLGRFNPQLSLAEKAVLQAAIEDLLSNIDERRNLPITAPRLTPSPLWLYCITTGKQFPVGINSEHEEYFETKFRDLGYLAHIPQVNR